MSKNLADLERNDIAHRPFYRDVYRHAVFWVRALPPPVADAPVPGGPALPPQPGWRIQVRIHSALPLPCPGRMRPIEGPHVIPGATGTRRTTCNFCPEPVRMVSIEHHGILRANNLPQVIPLDRQENMLDEVLLGDD